MERVSGADRQADPAPLHHGARPRSRDETKRTELSLLPSVPSTSGPSHPQNLTIARTRAPEARIAFDTGQPKVDRETGLPLWQVQLMALDASGGDVIAVTGAGDPNLTVGQPVQVWIGGVAMEPRGPQRDRVPG